MSVISVAIPVRNGGPLLGEVLRAVCAQRLDPGDTLELVVCDSGSTDGSPELARSLGAEVFSIAPQDFSHGATRNQLMERSRGARVAFLTQDAVPADDRWLIRLTGGLGLADDVGLAFGPYRPRPGASVMVARELEAWFRSFSPAGEPRIDRLPAADRLRPARALLGHCGYFTDANGCVARAAWEAVPFRPVAYAEDHLLAHDMLRSGFAKVFVPGAAVIHSHEYSLWEWLQRDFDETRAVCDLYDFPERGELRRAALQVRGAVGADLRYARGRGPVGAAATLALLGRSTAHHSARNAGAMLGARADQLPRALVRRLSLEGRAS